MASGDHAPLSIACARALIDKTYDKRKQAASEIEKYIFIQFVYCLYYSYIYLISIFIKNLLQNG